MAKKDWLKADQKDKDMDIEVALHHAAAKRRAREQLRFFSKAVDMEPLVVGQLSDIPDFIRPIELASKLKKHVESILRDIRRGALRARKDGRSYLIAPTDVTEYLSRLEFEATQKRKRSA